VIQTESLTEAKQPNR